MKKIIALSISVMSICTVFAQPSRDANQAQDRYKNGYSALWGRDGENWDPAGQLPDFSFAGYNMGESDIPSYPVRARLGDNGARPNDGGGDAGELQDLINTIQRPGTIIIPSGIWNINKRIILNKSGVVLRGENGAEFRMNSNLREIDNDNSDDASYAFSDGFFQIIGSISYGARKNITSNANQGSKVVVVESGTTFQPGDMIRIEQTDPSNESLFLYIHGSNQERLYWSENDDRCDNDRLLNRKDLFRFISKVVSQDGNRVTLERTLPLNIRTNWSPKIRKINMSNTTQNIGIENVRMRHSGDPFQGHFSLDGSNSIFMKDAVNSWVKDIEIIDCDNGVNVKEGFGCLIEDVRINTDKRDLSSFTGHHAIWLTGSSEYLVNDCEVNSEFIHDISVEGSASQNVYSKISGLNINIDHHRVAPWANLFTEFDMGKGTRPFSSSGLPCRGAHTARYTTFWNLKKNSGGFENFPYKAAGGGRREPSKDYNFANGIGILGCRLDSRSTSNSQFIEFSYGETLKNPNLYFAQLAKRLNTNQPPVVTMTAPANNATILAGDSIAVTATGSDPDGTVARIEFNVDGTRFATDPGPPYIRYFVPSRAGSYSLTLTAIDNDGNRTNTNPITVIVNENNVGPAGYTYAVEEKDDVVVSDRVDIAFGLNGNFVYLFNQTSDVTCNTASFGEDPLKGFAKKCFTRPGADYTPPFTYVDAVPQGGTVNANGEQDIAFGANGNFEFLMNQTSAVNCEKASFGGADPAQSYRKRCFVRPSADFTPPAGYTVDVNEGQTVVASEALDIAYGVNGKFVYLLNQENNVACNSTEFGSDPEKGYVKKCYVRPAVITSLSSNVSIDQSFVFPNPSKTGVFNLSESLEWKLLDTNGQLLLSGKSDVVDLTSYSSGIFFLSIGGQNVKLVKN